MTDEINWGKAWRLHEVLQYLRCCRGRGATTPEVSADLELRPALAWRMCRRLFDAGLIDAVYEDSEGSPGRGPVRWTAL